ncbi:C69 family dipeptidase [Clostridium oryzae]|uniref:Dipeptidase n=1 Tax=Clostridium oryzae TaxID=1450648 RepID=A0A1V4IJN6_9CLOT|nr:C69 family dipeptidase [Clostridium oryzae]OPJ60218.1 dipeptidase [Clostridium oryzae]
MKTRKIFSRITAGLIAVSVISPAMEAFACTTVIAGKNATADGSTIIARNDDCNPSKPDYFVVRKAKENARNAVYKSKQNKFYCKLPKHQYKYTATPYWTDAKGQYDEAGTNEKGVGMSATESTVSNDNVLKVDPFDETHGIQEDTMVTVVLPYIKSARDGVKRLGKIVTEQGAGEGDGIIFSDKKEIWYMEIGSGHEWVARRVPDDSYAVVANQVSIEDINFNDKDNYMYSSDIKSFVDKNKLNPNKDGKFIFKDIFGTNNDEDAEVNIPRVWDGQRILSPSQTKDQEITSKNIPMFRTPDRKITVADVEQVLSSHFNGTKYDTITNADNTGITYRPINVPFTEESHIIQFRPNMPNQISGIQWLALATPETSVYVPFYAGITTTPKTYRIGTDTPDTKSAYWTYRTTQVLAAPYYNEFLSDFIRPVQKDIDKEFNYSIAAVDKKALKIYKSSPNKVAAYLNKASEQNADYALDKFRKLNKMLLKKSTVFWPR